MRRTQHSPRSQQPPESGEERGRREGRHESEEAGEGGSGGPGVQGQGPSSGAQGENHLPLTFGLQLKMRTGLGTQHKSGHLGERPGHRTGCSTCHPATRILSDSMLVSRRTQTLEHERCLFPMLLTTFKVRRALTDMSLHPLVVQTVETRKLKPGGQGPSPGALPAL